MTDLDKIEVYQMTDLDGFWRETITLLYVSSLLRRETKQKETAECLEFGINVPRSNCMIYDETFFLSVAETFATTFHFVFSPKQLAFINIFVVYSKFAAIYQVPIWIIIV